MSRDFKAETAALRAKLESHHFDSAASLRELEETWAREMLGIRAEEELERAVHRSVKVGAGSSVARDALAHLAEAENWQWQLGTYSTGSGEGLASMGEVRSLQVAQAWLAAALFVNDGDPADAARARSLADEVEGDPNGMGRPFQKRLRELRSMIENASEKEPTA